MTIRRVVPALLLSLVSYACDEAGPTNTADLVRDSAVRVQHVAEGERWYDGSSGLVALHHGSGVVISDQGHVLTTLTVLDEPPRGTIASGQTYLGVFVPDGGWGDAQRRPVEVVWESGELDLAIIRVDGLQRQPATLSAVGPDESPLAGQAVFTWDFQSIGEIVSWEEDDRLELAAVEPALTEGEAQKVEDNEQAMALYGRPTIQHSAKFGQGGFGAPLFNACGEVIGTNTRVQGDEFEATVAFFAPHIGALVERLRSEPELSGLPVRVSTSVCVSPAASPLNVYVYVAAAVALGAAALGWTFWTHARLRRVMTNLAGRAVRSFSRRPSARPQASAGEPASIDDLTLVGADGQGNPVRLAVTSRALRSAGDEGLILGRQRALATLLLQDSTVSRRHAQLVEVAGGVGIVDLGSTGGTEVDGRRLEPFSDPVVLHPGATLRIGEVELTVSRL